jgi:hypothetical protein
LIFAPPAEYLSLISGPQASSATTEMSISTFSPVAAITAKLGWPRRRDLFLQIPDEVRQRYVFVVVG